MFIKRFLSFTALEATFLAVIVVQVQFMNPERQFYAGTPPHILYNFGKF